MPPRQWLLTDAAEAVIKESKLCINKAPVADYIESIRAANHHRNDVKYRASKCGGEPQLAKHHVGVRRRRRRGERAGGLFDAAAVGVQSPKKWLAPGSVLLWLQTIFSAPVYGLAKYMLERLRELA